jgi:hypothetical protein
MQKPIGLPTLNFGPEDKAAAPLRAAVANHRAGDYFGGLAGIAPGCIERITANTIVYSAGGQCYAQGYATATDGRPVLNGPPQVVEAVDVYKTRDGKFVGVAGKPAVNRPLANHRQAPLGLPTLNYDKPAPSRPTANYLGAAGSVGGPPEPRRQAPLGLPKLWP